MSEDELMSFIDIAKAANIPLSSVYYFNAKGVGPATVKIGRHLRVRRSDYEAWLTARES
jgi:predicted DNA-binding transcriptional regulator AlpA